MENLVKIILLLVFVIHIDPSQSITCIQCDSINLGEENCGYNLDTQSSCSSTIGCFTQLYDYNGTENETPGSYTRRDCIPSGSFSCDNNQCVKCTTNNCNNKLFPSDRNKCLSCTDCKNPKSEYCNVHGTNECITFYDGKGEVLLKSCYSDLKTPTRELCDDENYLDCRKCTGQNCNEDVKREGQKCFQCNGAECIDPVKFNAEIVDCRSSCYIGLNSNGEAVRGCASDFPSSQTCTSDDEISSACYICKGDFCNAILHPTNGRLRCHTCTGSNCAAIEDNLEYCPTYSANEKCVSIFSSSADVVIHRGCLSTLSPFCNNSTCLTCAYDKCNKDDSKNKNNFCIGCNSNEDSNCLKANLKLEKRCSTDSCYSKLIQGENEFGSRVERGCTADLAIGECNTATDCNVCQGKNCNNQLVPQNRISCFSCKNEECLKSLTSKICAHYIKNEACLTFFGTDNQVIYRDCYADAPEGTRDLCDQKSNLACTKCEGKDCNVDLKRRGSKCFRCSGISCFTTSLADLVDCQSNCYVGLNEKGEIVRDCADAVSSSSACGSQNKNCMTCADDYCNGILHPIVDRKMCIKCSGRDCDGNLDEKSEFCEVMTSNEKCVTVFNSDNTVKERGCSSSISSNCTGSSCLSCGVNNCNTHTSSNQIFYCVSCDSESDPTCVNEVPSPHVKACSSSSCYSKLVSKGSWSYVKKGCLAEEPCSGSSCTSCTGDLCNNKLFPSDRFSCLTCVGSDCARELNSTKFCSLYDQNKQACITIYNENNEVSYRNCYSDAAEGTQQICDDPTSLTCTKCTSKNCNTDIKRRGNKCFQCEGLSCFNNLNYPADVVDCTSSCYVGVNSKGETVRGCADKFSNSSLCDTNENGSGNCLTCSSDYCNEIVYPLVSRKKCIKCTGSDCDGNLDAKSQFCEIISSSESCVTVFNSDNTVKERGCSSTVSSNCTSSSCINCSPNNCNTHTNMNEKFYCVSCDSESDPSCVSEAPSPHVKACSSNSCYSKLVSKGSWNSVKKGCVADEPCSGSSCSSCTGDLCNNKLFPSDRLSCLTCIGKECASNSTRFCSLYNQNKQACITIYNDKSEVSYRNCYSDAAEGTQQICDDPTSLTCTKCTLKNCNADIKRRGNKCYQCEGLSCFNSLNYPADIVDCTSSCYVGVNSKGETVRGCSDKFLNSSLCDTNENGSGSCLTCSSDYCNKIQYPMKNRLTCHKCANGCEASENNVEYCEIAGDKERCVTAFDESNKVIERGCSMSLANKKYCSQNYKNCIECSGPNCNKINSKTNRLCIACNSAQDPNCVLNPSLVATVKVCSSTCFTRLLSGNLQRGCLEDLQDLQCNDANLCKSCSDYDKCNAQNYPADRKSCFNCKDLESCKTINSKPCIKYDKNDKCVTIFTGYNPTIRGCLSDQTQANQQVCNNSASAFCSSCSSNNCNFDSVRKDEQCIMCNSNSEPKCAQKPNELIKSKCDVISNGECYARVLADGATKRGCKGSLLSEEASCRNNTVSSQCSITPGSNQQIIPANRLRCFACDSRTDENCSKPQTIESLIIPCRNFVNPEQCVKISFSDGRVARGCLSDFPKSTCNDEKCALCSDQNGCNSNTAHKVNVSMFMTSLSVFVVLFGNLFK